MVEWDGMVVHMRWCTKCKAGRGFVSKTENWGAVAQFQAHYVQCQWATVHEVVVWLCICETWGGVWAKNWSWSAVAQFWAHCVKWQWGMVCRGGEVVHTMWWWWWGCAFERRWGGEGVGVKKPKLSCCGLVSGCNWVAGGEEGCYCVTVPPPVLT